MRALVSVSHQNLRSYFNIDIVYDEFFPAVGGGGGSLSDSNTITLSGFRKAAFKCMFRLGFPFRWKAMVGFSENKFIYISFMVS